LLPLFRTATNEDHKMFAILAEVDPIAGAEVDLVLENVGANALAFEKFPCSIRASAIVTFAAAAASPSSQWAKRLFPFSSM